MNRRLSALLAVLTIGSGVPATLLAADSDSRYPAAGLAAQSGAMSGWSVAGDGAAPAARAGQWGELHMYRRDSLDGWGAMPPWHEGSNALLPRFPSVTEDVPGLDLYHLDGPGAERREDSALSYVSPRFDRFQAVISYGSERQVDELGMKLGGQETYAMLGRWDAGTLRLAASYEKRRLDLPGLRGAEQEALRLSGNYRVDGVSLATAWESAETQNADGRLQGDSWYLGARYGLGNAYVLGNYSFGRTPGLDASGLAELEQASIWSVGAGWDLSRRFGFYALYSHMGDEDPQHQGDAYLGQGATRGQDGIWTSEFSGFSLGLWHNF